ncbi:MAG TPA: hypothetical protein VGB94_15155 [Acidobacteriaceae bacterium]
MCDKTKNSTYPAQQAPAALANELTTAEGELAAFYKVVLNQYGAAEATQAAQDWIEAVETMDWQADRIRPNWRKITILAASRLASRILNHPATA